jgi:hypothetical protein
MDKHIRQVLGYMLLKYPASSTLEVNRSLNCAVREVDYFDQLLNDYLYGAPIAYKYRDTGCYNDLIMATLNHVQRLI